MTSRVERTRVARDCVRRVRIIYTLPQPTSLALAERFPEGQLTLREFSKISRGARDLLRIEVGGALSLEAPLGTSELTVTYGKILGAWPASLIEFVERRLADAADEAEEADEPDRATSPPS